MNVQVGDIIKLENNQFVTVSELVKNISSLCPFLFSTLLIISPDFLCVECYLRSLFLPLPEIMSCCFLKGQDYLNVFDFVALHRKEAFGLEKRTIKNLSDGSLNVGFCTATFPPLKTKEKSLLCVFVSLFQSRLYTGSSSIHTIIQQLGLHVSFCHKETQCLWQRDTTLSVFSVLLLVYFNAVHLLVRYSNLYRALLSQDVTTAKARASCRILQISAACQESEFVSRSEECLAVKIARYHM